MCLQICLYNGVFAAAATINKYLKMHFYQSVSCQALVGQPTWKLPRCQPDKPTTERAEQPGNMRQTQKAKMRMLLSISAASFDVQRIKPIKRLDSARLIRTNVVAYCHCNAAHSAARRRPLCLRSFISGVHKYLWLLSLSALCMHYYCCCCCCCGCCWCHLLALQLL